LTVPPPEDRVHDIPTAMTVTAVSAIVGMHLSAAGARALRRIPAFARDVRSRRRP
jgi:hypothetical protein